MNKSILFFLLILTFSTSCNKDSGLIELELDEYEIDVIHYFKKVALGFEFGITPKITRKWSLDMKIFVGGEPNTELMVELEKIKEEINELATDGFEIKIENDSLRSNYYIFFGSGIQYAKIYAGQQSLIESNWGLFSVFWNGQNYINSDSMYVDITRANLTEQKHLLREELTQSLGLAKDSPLYPESIFQSEWTLTTNYAPIDKDLIRLLYHPNMRVGLNEAKVDGVLRQILTYD